MNGTFLAVVDLQFAQDEVHAWDSSLQLRDYVRILERAVERRHVAQGDVMPFRVKSDHTFHTWYILEFTATPKALVLADAYDEVVRVQKELCAIVDEVADRADAVVLDAVRRLEVLTTHTPQELVALIDAGGGSPMEKGRALEELMSQLLATVPGFTVSSRNTNTTTEEIDIVVRNDNPSAVWRREAALFLTECKNWTKVCGKNEVVLFQKKIENRRRRCTCGLLVSWNGFAETIPLELLRSSHEQFVVLLMTGEDVRQAVINGDFESRLERKYDEAVLQ